MFKSGYISDACCHHYEDLNFYKAIDLIMATLRTNNLFFESLKPWELKKNPASEEQLKVVLHLTLETLRVTGILLQPIVPNLSNVLLDKMNIPLEERYFSNLKLFSWKNSEFEENKLRPDRVILFTRIVTEDVKKLCINK